MKNKIVKTSIYRVVVILVFIYSIFVFNSCSTKNKAEEYLLGKEYSHYFQIKKGINISHWLSQLGGIEAGNSQIFSKQDAELLANNGFDHIRLPVDEENLWDEEGNKIISGFELLHNAINWSLKHNLKVIVDLHIIRSHTFNNKVNKLWTDEMEQQKFINIWLNLSTELIKYSNDLVAYELLNEAVADDSDDWNKLFTRTLVELRKVEPNRKIIIGSNRWKTPDTFDELVIPENDKNIILSFHYYKPHLFSHYKAHWSHLVDYTGPVHYPGQLVEKYDLENCSEELAKEIEKENGVFNREILLAGIQEPIEIAKKYGLQLYCGEFGSLPTVRRKDRLVYYKDVRHILESNNIAWSSWDYKGAFSIFHAQTGSLDNALVNILTE